MSTPKVLVLDYGIGNLLNVTRALRHVGADVVVAGDASSVVEPPDRIVMPGVGAFPDAMAEVVRRGFDDLVRAHDQAGRPFLGICVGMQLLFGSSEEFGMTHGLGLLPGVVRPVPAQDTNGTRQPIPHIGWSPVMPVVTDHQLFTGIRAGSEMYFVHSYCPDPDDDSHVVATAGYGGHRLAAIVGRGVTFGCQFHPERSADDGLAMLHNFLRM